MTTLPSSALVLPIAAVERDTGLSKDTLRIWERRYGFPQPLRDANGERVYPQDQVDKLRLLKRLMDQGHRPGKIAERSMPQLKALAEAGNARHPAADPAAKLDETLRDLLQLITTHRNDDLRRDLARLTVRVGLAHFVTGVIAPLTRLVGEGWARGELGIFEEHLFTESVQAVLRNAIAAVPHPGDSPRVLLTRPSPDRARSTASPASRYTSSTLFPSPAAPGIPKPGARSTIATSGCLAFRGEFVA